MASSMMRRALDAFTQGDASAARLLFVAKHLERVADYVTDICELTVYMVEAAFIKHSY